MLIQLMLGFCRFKEFVASGTLLSFKLASSSAGSMEVYLMLTNRAMNITFE